MARQQVPTDASNGSPGSPSTLGKVAAGSAASVDVEAAVEPPVEPLRRCRLPPGPDTLRLDMPTLRLPVPRVDEEEPKVSGRSEPEPRSPPPDRLLPRLEWAELALLPVLPLLPLLPLPLPLPPLLLPPELLVRPKLAMLAAAVAHNSPLDPDRRYDSNDTLSRRVFDC